MLPFDETPRGAKAAGQVPAPTIGDCPEVVPTEWLEKTKKTRGRAAKAKTTATWKPQDRRAQATKTATAINPFTGLLRDRKKRLETLRIIHDIDEALMKIADLESELNNLFN